MECAASGRQESVFLGTTVPPACRSGALCSLPKIWILKRKNEHLRFSLLLNVRAQSRREMFSRAFNKQEGNAERIWEVKFSNVSVCM